jgi:lysophospholipase L1-like esterase
MRQHSPSHLLNLVLLVGSTLLMLLVFEASLRWIAPIDDHLEPFKRDPTARTAAGNYIPSYFPPHFTTETTAESGLPGLSGRRRFTVNNYGHRGDRLDMPKPRGEFRIFMVGGSTTECFYLSDDEAITAVLQRALQARTPGRVIRVYNAGKSGDDSHDHLAMLAHRVVHLQPDLVIVFTGINDLSGAIFGRDFVSPTNADAKPLPRLSRTIRLWSLATDTQMGRRIFDVARQFGIVGAAQILNQQVITLTTNIGSRAADRRAVPVSDARPATNLELYRRNMSAIVGVARLNHVPIVLMTQQTTWGGTDPELERWQWMRLRRGVHYKAEHMRAALERYNDVMRELARAWSVPLFETAAAVPPTLEWFYDDVHFSPAGASKAATALADFLTENGPLRLW